MTVEERYEAAIARGLTPFHAKIVSEWPDPPAYLAEKDRIAKERKEQEERK